MESETSTSASLDKATLGVGLGWITLGGPYLAMDPVIKAIRPRLEIRGDNAATHMETFHQRMDIFRTIMDPSGEVITKRFGQGMAAYRPATDVPHEELLSAHLEAIASHLIAGGVPVFRINDWPRPAGEAKTFFEMYDRLPTADDNVVVVSMRGRFRRKLRYRNGGNKWVTELLSECTWVPGAIQRHREKWTGNN